MKVKVKLALMALVCSFATYVYASAPAPARCDSSTTSRCIIYGVGEGTGQLIDKEEADAPN